MTADIHSTQGRLAKFFGSETAGGICLMISAILAIMIANSPLDHQYFKTLDLPLAITLGSNGVEKPLLLWINDGLMAIFFLYIGLELKRELLEGHLAGPGQITLPAFAAVGGMLVPATIYWIINAGDAAALQGWAIPAATDIAFAVGVLALLGPGVPPALKVFLLSVAIFDDLGAILIIAIFYTADLSISSLLTAAIISAGLFALNRSNVTQSALYVLLGIALWLAVLKSGVHATLTGVVLALSIPSGTASGAKTKEKSLSSKMEKELHQWVTFGILPTFAFANAGVPLAGLSFGDLLHPVPMGIVAGLTLGKLIGITLFTWIAVKLQIAKLGDDVTWTQVVGTSLLCGIGFTMSFFISSLAFEHGGVTFSGLDRLGILLGSLISGVSGYFILRLCLSRQSQKTI